MNFACKEREPVGMECEPAALNASSIATNVSPRQRSVANNLSWKLR
jgi:hypothetical protein